MASVSLKDRMKQFQALKTSTQVKTQAALSREKELDSIGQKSSIRASINKVQLETIDGDDRTSGGETQTTAGETAATPASPPPLTSATEEDKLPEQSAVEVDTPEEKTGEEQVQPGEPSEVVNGSIEEPITSTPSVQKQEDGAMLDDDMEVEEEVVEEIVYEDEEVLDETEEVEIEEYEEVVEEIEEEVEGDDDEVEEIEVEEETGDEEDEHKPFGYVGPEVTDEKSADEFAAEPHPVVFSSIVKSNESDEEAPMDEMEFIRDMAQKRGVVPRSNSDRFEEGPGVLPVFQILDEEEARMEKNASSVPKTISLANDEPEQALVRSAPEVEGEDDVEAGSVKEKRSSRSGGVPLGMNDDQKRRWKCVICFLLVIGACAVTALVLPFVIDYNNDDIAPTEAPTSFPTVSPAPTMEPSSNPTDFPTISPAPTASPSELPSASPTVSLAPTSSPTPRPTRNPTPSPTQSPTRAPVVTTPAPVPQTPAPVATPAPVPVTPAPVTTNPPTLAPVVPTPAPVPTVTPSPTSLRLGNFIDVFLVPISGEEVFEDQDSPQFQAAQYIAEEDPYTPEISSEDALADRFGAVTFYFATGGDEWTQCSLGDTACAGPWLTGDTCGWAFLSCNADGRIISFNFDGGNQVGMRGFIPPEVKVFEALEDFVIIDEAITGTLPEEFGATATNVRRLTIQGTEIGGSVPDGYLSSSPLESFLMGRNNLNGPVPIDVGSPSTLTEIDLGGNKLIGSLSDGIAGYENLETLALNSNLIRGSIPESVYGMSNLQRLYLNNNPFMSGSLSSSVRNLSSIQELRVGSTGIGGLIPDEIFTLTSIEELDFSDAQFRGPLSSTFLTLGNTLRQLNLQDNEFTGTVPATFGQLAILNVLNLQGNGLTGSIAPEICALRGLGEDSLRELTVDCAEVSCSCCTECF